MKRTVVAILMGLMLSVTLTGCGNGDEGGSGVRREPPAERRAAPGSEIGPPQAAEEGDSEGNPPPPTGDE